MTPTLMLIQLSLIRPAGPVDRNATDFLALVDNVRRFGVLQPVLVAPGNCIYILIHGSRRLAAAEEVGLAEIPALVKPMGAVEILEVRLSCDPRRDLHETARRMRALLAADPDRTAAQLAVLTGLSQREVEDTLGLTDLIPEARGLPTANAVLLSKLRPRAQRQLLDEAKLRSRAELAVLVKDRLAEAASARKKSRDREPVDYVNAPRLRALKELKEELERPTAVYRLVTKDMDPVQAFVSAVAWSLCVDRESIQARAAADAARRKKLQESERVRHGERQQRQQEERQYQGDGP
jgi:ParB/RepB/Spo0J family partition protein